MALPSSGELSWSQIQTEFGGGHPIGINEYYGVATGIPGSGEIGANHFRGASAAIYLSLGAFSHAPHPHQTTGAYYNKYFKNNSISHNHTVGSVSLPSAKKLVELWVRGNGADNVESYFDRIYFGGTLVWDGTQYDVSTSGDGTSFGLGAGYNFNGGSHSIRIDTYSQYESTDKLYISSMKFKFINQ
jgi:hypothetical protein